MIIRDMLVASIVGFGLTRFLGGMDRVHLVVSFSREVQDVRA